MAIFYFLSRGVNVHEDESGRRQERILGRTWILEAESWVLIFSLLPVLLSPCTRLLSLQFIFCVHIMDRIASVFKNCCEQHGF